MKRESSTILNPSVLSAVAISIAVVAGLSVLASTWKRTHDVYQKIAVTGVAHLDFESDKIVWSPSFERTGTQINDVYALMKADAEMVRTYLLSHGVSEKEFVFDAVNIGRETRIVQAGNQSHEEFAGYRLSQSVTVQSGNIDKVERISREISELLKSGMQLTSNSPLFYYSKLAEVKANLLAQASEEGRSRAMTIARNAQGNLGSLRKADMGIFQITGQNTNEDYSWSGAYNTTSRFKTASVTVKMEFNVE
ncbi:MAG: SIMPL domain-containing protein [Candidatus Kapaibacterium sp.]